jgi:hypothetical protein
MKTTHSGYAHLAQIMRLSHTIERALLTAPTYEGAVMRIVPAAWRRQHALTLAWRRYRLVLHMRATACVHAEPLALAAGVRRRHRAGSLRLALFA